jgi:NitT/TauT family transport system substrate-binding protein
MQLIQSRRDFLASLSAAGAAAALGGGAALADEGPAETTTLRLADTRAICLAPVYIAKEVLRAEGFTDIRSVPSPPATVGRGIDFDFQYGAWIASHLDDGEPLTALAGVHSGCHEVFAHEPIRTIGDLKGKRVGVRRLGAGDHLNLALMAADVGLDPQKDITWVTESPVNPMALFATREVDAFLASPPEPQELRARKIGHTIINIATDKPWSQYFCCMVFGNRAFVRDHPIATKHFLRAILKATDMCAAEPERTAQRLVDGGFAGRYDYALQTLTELPYARWREFDPEDALRFYALRLKEVGMIKSSPNKLIAAGTDWRFLNELKRELKA